MDTIGMDTYGLVAGVADVAPAVLTRHDRAFPSGYREDSLSPGTVLGPRWSGKRRWKEPLRPSCARPFAAR